MALSQMIAQFIQAVELLLAVPVNALEVQSLMLAHVAVTIARAPKGPPTTSEGAANASWIRTLSSGSAKTWTASMMHIGVRLGGSRRNGVKALMGWCCGLDSCGCLCHRQRHLKPI